MKNQNKGNSIWTKNFTILTLGSVVSMLGNALSGFAFSLLVLDYTKSSLTYAIFLISFTLPQIVMPIFSGAILDRFSRKKTIYTLDFISAGFYFVAALVLNTGFFNFPIFAVCCFIIGCINSIYTVAYQSFYPLLLTPENMSKGYSISSVLETLTAVMVPVSALLYNLVGMVPLLMFNAGSFLLAAIFETRIDADEKYIETQRENSNDEKRSVKMVFSDIKEGMKYLVSERGLFIIALFFFFMAISGGVSSVITLPYFKDTYENGEYIYMVVWGMAVVGRFVGGLILYRLKIPMKLKYRLTIASYLVSSIVEAVYLYTYIPVMMVGCLVMGLFGVTSYNIRISATQNYVPDEKKGRFNGVFSMLSTAGNLLGQLFSGLLGLVLPVRMVLTVFMGLTAVVAVLLIGGFKKDVKKIYEYSVE